MTETCVAACPAGLGAPQANGVCPRCGDEPYFDAEADKCVFRCPNYAPYIGLYSRVCKTCPENTPYWDGTNCVERCASASVKVGSQLVCAGFAGECGTRGICASCVEKDEKRPFWNGKNCVSCFRATDGKLPYFDNVFQKCTDDCPDVAPLIGAGYVCRPCPAGAPYWDYLECRSCATAFPNSREFWDPVFSECAVSCPAALAPVDGSKTCRTCAEIDPEKPHWDERAGECVRCPRGTYDTICRPCDEWQPETPVWDDVAGRCASCAAVYGAGRALWDPNRRECVSKCPAGLTADNQSSDYDPDATAWCKSCSDVNDGFPVWDAATGECVACPADKPNIWDNSFMNTKCAEPCPDEAPFWNGAACWRCERAWEGRANYYSPSAGQCVDACPEETPVRAETSMCMSCAEAHPGTDIRFWDQAAHACVAACPETHIGDICRRCESAASGRPYWNQTI